MGQILTAVCKCKDYSEDNLVNAESKNYFLAMTGGRQFFHGIMVIATGGVWIGWLIGGYFLTEAEYECTSCGNKIGKNKLRIGGKTKNVNDQTLENKETPVSNNKKSEEVSSSVEKRLEDILNLKEKGLISDDDYEIKKKNILKDM